MNRKIFSYFELAGELALKKDKLRNFYLGCVAIRNDGTMVTAFNSPVKFPSRVAHSEYRVAQKIDHGATVYVARVRLDTHNYGCARPCRACLKILISKRVRKIYYTIGPTEYGIIDFTNGSLNERQIF